MDEDVITITHMLYSKRAFGIALHKLKDGKNIIDITVTDVKGERLCPFPIVVVKSELIEKYGIEDIQKHTKGIWVPLKDIGLFPTAKRGNDE